MPDQADQMSRRFEDFDLRLRNVEHDVASIKANYATRSDVAELRADMQKMQTESAKMHTDTTRWIIATVISLFLGFSGLFFVMSQAVNKPAPSAAPAPIIIQVPWPASSPSTGQPDRGSDLTPHR